MVMDNPISLDPEENVMSPMSNATEDQRLSASVPEDYLNIAVSHAQ